MDDINKMLNNKPNNTSDDRYIKLSEVSRRTGLSLVTLRNLLKKQKIRCFTIAKRYYMTEIDYTNMRLDFAAECFGIDRETLIKHLKLLRKEEIKEELIKYYKKDNLEYNEEELDKILELMYQ